MTKRFFLFSVSNATPPEEEEEEHKMNHSSICKHQDQNSQKSTGGFKSINFKVI